jgi:actin-related protein 5
LENVLRHHDPTFDPGNNSDTMAPGESHQLHLAVERIRAPEVLFQPALIGSSEAGLAETIEFVLKKFTPEQQVCECRTSQCSSKETGV